MKKRVSLIALVLVAAFALVIIDCGPTDTPPVENVKIEVIDGDDGPGGAIKVTWDAPADVEPDEYVVSVDGVDQVAVTTTEDVVKTPGAIIEVYAVYGGDKSNPEKVDLSATVTDNIEVWSINDPSADHPSAFGFDEDGAAAHFAIGNKDDWDKMDFYISMGEDGLTPSFTAPYARTPEKLNDERNATSDESGTFDNLKIVSPTGQGLYATVNPVTDGGLYGFWLDNNDEYDASDHFGKIHVTALTIDGTDPQGLNIYKAVLKLAYQTQQGLRWVVTK